MSKNNNEPTNAKKQQSQILNALAEAGYSAYCEAVGGKAFNGDPLPTWKAFCADPKKQKQVEAWTKAATAIVNEFLLAGTNEEQYVDCGCDEASCDDGESN